MDCRRQARRLLIAAALVAACALVAASGLAAAATRLPLRAAQWLPPDRRLHALAVEPSECLRLPTDATASRLVAIGRAAFRTPLLLGGQAARAGLSCNSCHRNGRGNPDLQFPGLSGAPGTADVTSSLMSSHRGDGTPNPKPIPDLSAPPSALKVSRAPSDPALEKFIHGLIVEEFDGPEPTALTLDGIAEYVRALSPDACPVFNEQPVRLASYIDDAHAAVRAAQATLDAGDPGAARLMLASARSALGLIHERFAAASLAGDRDSLRAADRELAALQDAVDHRSKDAPLRFAAWLGELPMLAAKLQHDESQSLFDPGRLAAALGEAMVQEQTAGHQSR